MSEPLEIGDALKAAREARGWTQQDAATKLRLMARQVEAMEAEDYATLGQPVFARGFVRNYARLLGLDPEPLLNRMSESGAAPAEKVDSEPYSAASKKAVSPILIGILAVLVLILAVPVATYFWLNSGEEVAATEPAMQSAQTRADARPAPEAQLQSASTPVMPAVPDMAIPDHAATDAAKQESQPVTAPPNPQMPLSAPKPAPASAPEQPVSDAAAQSLATRPDNATATAPDNVAPEPPENPYLPPNFRNKSIRLQFDQDAWVQIRDGNGRTIHSTLSKAGSTVELSGKPPFEFVVGNAANVRMTYSGRPFDIKPYIGETVARFTLE
jgi:cytoskeleton protein RodZ